MVATVGSISVDLAVKSAGFEAGMKKAATTVERESGRMAAATTKAQGVIGSFFGGLAAGSALAGVATLTGALAKARQALSDFDKIANDSRTVGLRTKSFQAFSFAALEAGVSQDKLNASLGIFAKNVGLPVDSVTWTNMAPPLREPSLVKGDVKAISGFYFTGFLNLTENLKIPESEVVAFMYSDYGIDLYGNAVVVRVDWLKANEDTVRRFLGALNTGFKATLKDPKGSIVHVKAAEPLSNEATELKRLQLAISANMVNDEVRKNGLLGIDPARMQRAIEQAVVSFELGTKPTVAQVFTGAYLPPAAERKLD